MPESVELCGGERMSHVLCGKSFGKVLRRDLLKSHSLGRTSRGENALFAGVFVQSVPEAQSECEAIYMRLFLFSRFN